MDCWAITTNRMGVVCNHGVPGETSLHVLQQAVNGWVFMVLDPSTLRPIVVYCLMVSPTDTAGAQRAAHVIIDEETASLEAVLDFYDQHDPHALVSAWHGPDPLGGYGRVVGDALFLVNGHYVHDDRGTYALQRFPLTNGGLNFKPTPIRMIDGGDLEDVQRRAYEVALKW